MKKCTHDLAERETACADGMCPICLSKFIEKQRAVIKDWEQVSDKHIHKYKLLLKENRRLTKRITTLELFDPDQQND